MNTFKTIIAVAVSTLFAGTALAQSNYEIEQRDRNEQARIDRGVQSGQLTPREAERLQGQRAQIERLEQRARADGTLTRNERARIDGAQDRLSRDIRRESHDRQTVNGSGQRWDNRGNHNGWDNRRDDHGRHNGWGRGTERGQEHSARGQGIEHRDANDSHPDRSNHRQASMPQAQVRSTMPQGERTTASRQGSDSGHRTR